MTDASIPSSGANRGRARAATDAAKTLAGKGTDGAKKAAKVGLEKTAKGVDRAQRTVTQSDAFDEFNSAMEEMTAVVSVHHARISDLEARLIALEELLDPRQRSTTRDE